MKLTQVTQKELKQRYAIDISLHLSNLLRLTPIFADLFLKIPNTQFLIPILACTP